MTIYDLTKEVYSHDHPSQSKEYRSWVEQLDKVLVELGESTIGNDNITHIYLSSKQLLINTVRHDRGCERHGFIGVPIHVLMSSDPVHSAKYERTLSRISSIKYQIASSVRNIDDLTEQLHRCETQLINLTQPSLDFES